MKRFESEEWAMEGMIDHSKLHEEMDQSRY
jgi:hypothetical protein